MREKKWSMLKMVLSSRQKVNKPTTNLIWPLLFIIVGAISFLTEKIFIPELSSRERVFLYPSREITNFSFGYNDFISSAIWLRLLQDFDYCERGKLIAQNETAEETQLKLQDSTRLNYLLTKKLKDSSCNLGWVYQMLEVTTDLDPLFLTAYQAGGTMLSVVVDDREGASRIYKKGTKYFPQDWRLNYYAAYHALFEMQDAKRAAALLRRAGEYGAPAWVYSLAGGLYTEMGQAQFAKTVLVEAAKRTKGKMGADRIINRLNQVNEILGEKKELPPSPE